MKMSKRTVNRLQNFVLVLLSVSALWLVSRLYAFEANWSNRVQSLLTVSNSSTQQPQRTALSSSISAVHLVVTDDSEYGRYSALYLPVDSTDLAQIIPLFREALGSAIEADAGIVGQVQSALKNPSILLDFTVELPCQVIAAWLDESTAIDHNVRSMALTTQQDSSAVLYLISSDGTIFAYDTALISSAVEEAAHSFAPNGGSFAFESNYASLRPYTVLAAEAITVPDIHSTLPDSYTSYNLLTALDFNAHTNSRYWETDNVEVVVESPRTLRISPDGTVVYEGDSTVPNSLYLVSSSGKIPTAAEALQSADYLAFILASETGASSLYLHTMEPTDSGWIITFRYQFQGIPAILPNETDALSVTIEENTITSFTYHCRTLSATENRSALLPASMAIAIASLRLDADLSIGYVSDESDTFTACWLAG